MLESPHRFGCASVPTRSNARVMVQEMFLHLLQGSARATYLLDFNFVDIATCFASLAAAEDDRHSNCENSTTSDVLNSTEHPGIFSFRCWICIGLGSLMFGLFAGCLNSHLVRLGQCWETSFLFSCFKHVLGNLFAFIIARLSFFL